MKLKIIFSFLFVLIVLSFLAGCSNKPGRYDSFAQCLTEKGVTMYGTEWCSHCQNQKKLFGRSFGNINYIDCDRDKNACLAAGVEGYPTWVIDGKTYPGEQRLERLATLSGCELTKTEQSE